MASPKLAQSNVPDALAAITILSRAWTANFADAVADALRAKPDDDDGLLDLDEALSFLEVVFRLISESEEPQIPVWDEDLAPYTDPAVEQVLALLQTDANLCARLRAELAQLS
jgi:hypothetical protein